MKWHNGFERLPEDKQEVLLSIQGTQYIATYDAKHKVFRPLNGKPMYYIAKDKETYWRPSGR